MAENVVVFLVPITLGLGLFMMLWGIRYFENKENMAMIERGMEPRKRRTADPSRTLRNALMFIGAGAGLLLAIMVSNAFGLTDGQETGVYFSLIAIFGGLGMLAAYLYERRNPPAKDEL